MNATLDTIEYQFGKPTLSRKGVGLALLIAFLYTLFYTAVLSNVEGVPFLPALIGTALSTSIKGLLLLGSWYFIVREMHAFSGWIKLGMHVVAGAVFVVAWYYGYLLLFDWLFGLQYLQGGGFLQNSVWVMFSGYLEYAIAFSIIHVIDSLKKLKQREQQAAQLRELSNQQQIANLKAQLNPHFLFNTLNSINAMVSRDVEQTRNMIAMLSEMLRYSLDSFETERVPLEEEIGFVEKYLELEKHRYGDRLSYAIEVDERLSNVEIPPMTIQPIVENAVKHGVAPAEDGGAVTIDISRNQKGMKIQVTDTGQGIPNPEKLAESDGIGIRNTNKHLKKRYGEEATLQFESEEKGGTKVWFTIPLNEVSP